MSQVVVFDLDGTLIDSAPDIHRCANMVLAEEGLGEITLDQARGFVGHGAPTFVERMMAAIGKTDGFDTLLERFLHHYEAAPELTQTYAGVIPALTQLKADGFALGLCTNKPISPTHVVMDYLGLTPFFDMMLGGDSLPQRKPDPTPLLHILSEMGATNSLYVGDSEVDAETADRASVDFALFTEGYRKTPVEQLPHKVPFDHFDTLPQIARSLLASPVT